MPSTSTALASSGGSAGTGGWDISATKVYQTTNANVTLTSSDAGKTHVFMNGDEIDVTLPDATTLSSTGPKFGIYVSGATVNIRLNGGRLLVRLLGSGGPAWSATTPVALDIYGANGCVLECASIGTAAGGWLVRDPGQTILAPKLVKETTLEGATKDVWTAYMYFSVRNSNSPGVVPRIQAHGYSSHFYPISDTQFIHFGSDSVNGTCYRIGLVASDGTVSYSAFATLSSYVAGTRPATVCVLAQASGGYDYILVDYVSASGVRSARILEITTGTTTVNGTSAAVDWPTTDNNGKTLAQFDASNGGYSMAGMSGTTAMYSASITNTTDSLVQSFSWLMTRAGSVGTPSLTFGTPQKLNTTNATLAPSFSIYLGNVSNRLAVFSSDYGTTAWGNNNAATDIGAVLDVSTPATPTVAYRISYLKMGTYGYPVPTQPWYSTDDNYFYCSYSLVTGAYTSLVKFKCGSSGITDAAIVPVDLVVPQDIQGLVATPAATLFSESFASIYPLDGINIHKGAFYIQNNNFFAPSLAGGVNYNSICNITVYRALPISSAVNSATAVADSVIDSQVARTRYCAYVGDLNPTNGGYYNKNYVTFGIFMRGGRYLVMQCSRTQGGTMGLATPRKDTTTLTLEMPLVA